MSLSVSVVVAQVLAASPSPSPLTPAAKVLNDDTVSPGWLGLVVFLAMAAAAVFLFRSFRAQLAKVPPTFDARDPGGPPAPRPAGPGPAPTG